MLKGNAPCICGHSNSNHTSKHFWLNKDVIDVRMGYSVKRCDCMAFKLDNLKFLEREYDSRK